MDGHLPCIDALNRNLEDHSRNQLVSGSVLKSILKKNGEPRPSNFKMSHLANDVDFDAAAPNSSIADHESVICTLKSNSEMSKKKSVTFN